MDSSQKLKELQLITNKRLRDEGWENVTQFTRGSGVPYSVETTRRAFVEVPDRTLSPDTLAIILKFLNFSVKEIKQMLQTYTDDKYLWPMLGDSDQVLTIDEQAVVNIYKKIVESKPELRTKVAEVLSLVAMLAEVNAEAELKQLQRKQKG